VINSYFSVLLSYGDQNVILSYGDLVEVERRPDGTIDVGLRNLEYDLTSSIKKVVYGFQSVDAVLASMEEPVRLNVYITPDTLPEPLREAPGTIERVADEIRQDAEGTFSAQFINPDDPESPVSRQDLYDQYGLQPIAASVFAEETYYLYMVLQVGDRSEVIYPQESFSEADIRGAIEAALKRTSPGFLKVVGLWTPPEQPTPNAFGQMQQPLSGWSRVAEQLRRDYQVRSVDLSQGRVPAEIDVLVLVAPQGLDEVARFAVDQFLMRGGSVVVAAGRYGITSDPLAGGLALKPLENGLHDMLEAYDVRVERSLVMDPQNEPFPVPVTRQVGEVQVREIQLIDYPFFVNVLPEGMDEENPIVADLQTAILNWASPLELLGEGEGLERAVLLESSGRSWTTVETNIQPNYDLYPQLGFPMGGEGQSYPLAVAVRGRFESYFQGRPSPFQGESSGSQGEEQAAQATPQNEEGDEPTATPPPPAVIEASPDTARLVVFGSSEFLDDVVLDLSAGMAGNRYLNNLQLLQNAVDWSVEDLDLLDIRSRGTHTRLIRPMQDRDQSVMEGINYGVALLALAGIGLVWRSRRAREEPMELAPEARETVEEGIGGRQ
jgi:ABC-2 type transport system permease protein